MDDNKDLKKRILITGGTNGIGLETASQLCQLGHSVCITARSVEKALGAEESIKAKTPSADVSHILLELSSFDSVNSALAETRNMPAFDVVILNAGSMFPEQTKTEDGIEYTFMVNYLAHFLLAQGLVASKEAGRPMHFVLLSSVLIKACTWPFWSIPKDERQWPAAFGPPAQKSGFREYALSKYALTLLAAELANHNDVTATAVNPGNSMTAMTRNMEPWLRKALSIFKYSLIPNSEAAENVVRGVLSPLPPGKFYHQDRVASLPKQMTRETTRLALLSLSRTQLMKAGIQTEGQLPA